MGLNITGRNLYFKSGIDNKQLKKDSKEGVREIDKMTGKVKKSGASMAKSLKNAFKVIIGAVIVKKIIDIGKALFKAGSQADEIRSKFEVTFQSINEEADKTAEALAKGFGLARVKAEELLSTTGDLLTGFGFSREAALETSNVVQQLAVDLASFNNLAGGAAQASTIITKALLGEKDSLVTLGVKILDSDIQHRLLEQGMDKLTGTALLQAKALITLQMITEQSKNAIGDFARTSQSAANQQRILKENIKDLTINLSKRLVPAVGEALINTNKLVRSLVDMTEVKLSDTFRDEQVALNTLVLQITSANTSQEKRLKLIQQLREEYPFFLEDLKTEELTNENIAKRLAEVNQNYVNKIIIQIQNERIAKAATKEANRFTSQAEAELALLKDISTASTALGISHKLVGKSYKEQVDIVEKYLKVAGHTIRVKGKLKGVTIDVVGLYDKWLKSIERTKKANIDLNAVEAARVAILKMMNVEAEELFNRTKVVTKEEEKPVVREVDPNLERIETTERLKVVTKEYLELSKKGVKLQVESLAKLKPHIASLKNLYFDLKNATILEMKQRLKMIDKMIEQEEKYGRTVETLLDERREVLEEMLKQIYLIEETMYAFSAIVGEFDRNIGQLISSTTTLVASIATGDIAGIFSGIVGIFRNIIAVLREQTTEDSITANERLNKTLEILNRNLREQIKLLAELNGTPWLEGIVNQMGNTKKEADELLKSLDGMRLALKIAGGYKLITTEGWDLEKWQEMIDKYIKWGYEVTGFKFGEGEIDVQGIIDTIKMLDDEIKDMMDQFTQELTGTTTESIADSIAQGFDEGLGSAEIFADTFEDLIRGSMINALKRSLYDQYLVDFYKKFAEYAEKDGLSKEEIRDLGLDYRTMVEDAEKYWADMMKVWEEAFGEDFGLPAEEDPLTGAIRGLSEETAGVLAGQMMAIRINVAEGLEVAENSFLQLVEIADNTSYNRYLEQITAILQQNSEQALIRSTGG